MPVGSAARKVLVTGLTAPLGRANTRVPTGRILVANHASAKKRVRQTVKRTARNRQIRTYVRTCVKRVHAAVELGDNDAAKKALIEAISRIDGAVSKGIFHRKTGSRYITRLTHQVNGLQS
jgi:small subunit ribosomal protein S20